VSFFWRIFYKKPLCSIRVIRYIVYKAFSINLPFLICNRVKKKLKND
jgi:hypothetical protein